MMEMRIGERVVVDAAVTGDGEQHNGWIADVYEFLRETFVGLTASRWLWTCTVSAGMASQGAAVADNGYVVV